MTVGWQPISTAPRDGTVILIWSVYGQSVAARHWDPAFTHWMPLPSPPSSEAQPLGTAGEADVALTVQDEPRRDILGEMAAEGLARKMAEFPSEPDQGEVERVADIIGWHFGALVSGNRMPDMSGDPRNRLLPHVRRVFDQAAREAARAIILSRSTTLGRTEDAV